MASLSDDMKSKRDVKRRSSVLIIDKDLGNYGLYKSILSMEYELECINSIPIATSLCNSKLYDVIIVDGGFEIDKVRIFYEEVTKKYKKDKPILLALEEQANKDSIIGYLGVGAREYIPKPFTKEGLSNTIYEQLKKRRDNIIRKSLLIVDENYAQLKELKGYLTHKYNVSCVNSYELARKYMMSVIPDLIICEIGIFEMCIEDACRCANEENGKAGTGADGSWITPVLVIADAPDGETISKCAKFSPEGFLMKPIDKDMLLKTLERIFLVKSYTDFTR